MITTTKPSGTTGQPHSMGAIEHARVPVALRGGDVDLGFRRTDVRRSRGPARVGHRGLGRYRGGRPRRASRAGNASTKERHEAAAAPTAQADARARLSESAWAH